jgi:AcrR family transcriptional regulator
MNPKTTTRATRMAAQERRELVLQAATRAFAKTGFAGTSTDAVAREAGVSQPYVVRIFGTKLDLFLEVYNRACDQIAGAFEAVLDEGEFDPDNDDDWARMGAAYTGLLTDRDFLLVLMHGYSAGAVEEIAEASRNGMGTVFEVVKRTGCTDERATEFIAHGMLLNVMIAMGAPEHVKQSDALAALTVCAFGEALSAVAP